MLPISKRNEQTWFPSLLNELLNDDWAVARSTSSTMPAMNIAEDEKGYHVEIATPGMTKEDIAVHVNAQDQLVIEVEKKESTNEEHKDRKYLRREFAYSRFTRTLLLPDDVDKEGISAKVSDGILRIALPKVTPSEQPDPTRVIEIQ